MVYKIISCIILVACFEQCCQTPRFRIVEAVPMTADGFDQAYLNENKGKQVFAVIELGETLIHDGMITNCAYIIRPIGWAKVGDTVSIAEKVR